MIRSYKNRIVFKRKVYNFLFDTHKQEENINLFMCSLEMSINLFKKYFLFKNIGFTHVYADVVIYGGCPVIDNAIALKFLKSGLSVAFIQDKYSNNNQQKELNKVLSMKKIKNIFYKSFFNDFDMDEASVIKELNSFISLNPNMFCYIKSYNKEVFTDIGKLNENDEYSYLVSIVDINNTVNSLGYSSVYSKTITRNKFCKNIKFKDSDEIKIPTARSHGIWSKLYLTTNPYYKPINENVLLFLKDGTINEIDSKDMLKNILSDIVSLDKKISNDILSLKEKNKQMH